MNCKKEIELLTKIIKYLKKTIDYNGFYNAYLLKMIDEKEFEKISEDFIIKPSDKIDYEQYNALIEFIDENPDIEFDNDEIADIMGITTSKLTEFME